MLSRRSWCGLLVAFSWLCSVEDARAETLYKFQVRVIERTSLPASRISPRQEVRVLTASAANHWCEALTGDEHVEQRSRTEMVTVERATAELHVGQSGLFNIGYDGDRPVTRSLWYGRELRLTPTSQSDGQVRLRIEFRSSELVETLKTYIVTDDGKPPRAIELPNIVEQSLSTEVALPVEAAVVLTLVVDDENRPSQASEVLIQLKSVANH
ncbi:MAG: hypothetical protein QM775_14095 [Pirellulales bacterium]